MLRRIFAEEVKKEVDKLSDDIIKGTMTIEEYRKFCGKREGLLLALEIYDKLVKKRVKEELIDDYE